MRNNPVSLYLSSLGTDGSRKSMRNVILKFLREQMNDAGTDIERYPWANVRVDDVLQYKETLVTSGVSPATVNSVLAGVRGVLYQAMYAEGIPSSQQWDIGSHRDLKSVKTVTPYPTSTDTSLKASDWERVITGLDDSLQGLRDKALVVTLWGKNVSADDICKTYIESLPLSIPANDRSNCLIYLPNEGAYRRVGCDRSFGILDTEETSHIERWIDCANLQPTDPLFVRVRRNKVNASEPLTKAGIGYTITRVGDSLCICNLSLRNMRRATRA